MTQGSTNGKTIGEQMFELLERKPENYDVVFSVGPEKKIVKAVKFVLKSASPVFEKEFEERWENAVVQQEEGIPLPDLDPHAFQLFVKLLIKDNWTAKTIQGLNLSADTLLNLLAICRRFQIVKALQNIEDACKEFTRGFKQYTDTDEFLKMSQANLETYLSCQEIPMTESKIFEAALKWAKFQCEQKQLEVTDQNFREVLGKSLYGIRFPTMTNPEFTKITRNKSVLSPEEKLAVHEFIGMDIFERALSYDTKELPFKIQKRPEENTLCLKTKFSVVESPSFASNGSEKTNDLQTSHRIELRGFGFLGPSEDSQFDVTMEVKTMRSGRAFTTCTEKLEKRVFARKGQVFYFYLDKPITIEPISDSYWSTGYRIFFSLKGPNLRQFNTNVATSLTDNGIDFRFRDWGNQKPISELLYRKV